VARGEKLSFRQEDLHIQGHAIEIRVCAEDPANNFLPDTGTLSTYKIPEGPGIRVDNGYEEGMEIPIYYDPMISKLITYGSDRKETIARMIRAIDDYRVKGIATTLPFCRFVMQHDAFVSGNFDTHFVKKYFTPEAMQGEDIEEGQMAAILAGKLMAEKKTSPGQISEQNGRSAWRKNRVL
jgi:acetyl/propionyl-CoA carboxylase alpha subunit